MPTLWNNSRKVIFSREEVDAFRARWPGGNLRSRSYWYEFDSTGDLIDTDVPDQDDGPDSLALSQDAADFLAQELLDRAGEVLPVYTGGKADTAPAPWANVENFQGVAVIPGEDWRAAYPLPDASRVIHGPPLSDDLRAVFSPWGEVQGVLVVGLAGVRVEFKGGNANPVYPRNGDDSRMKINPIPVSFSLDGSRVVHYI